MLVISRRNQESFYIGDDIKVTVIGINNGQVKIAIEAPRSVNIARSELLTNDGKGNK